MIYIATDIHGRGLRHITAFDSRNDFLSTALQWLDRSDRYFSIKTRSSIDDICDALHDHGPGLGARSHHRVTRREAFKLSRDGIKTFGFFSPSI
jgi:hypothetical protein